jgi:lipopolysaccharide heptosyltransferase II
MMPNKKILFFKPGAIGDLLQTLPSLGALRRAFPEAQVTVVVSPGQELLIQETPIADHILVFDKTRLKKSFSEFIAFGMKLRREQYNVFIDMQPSLRSMILRWLSGTRRTLVYRKQKKIRAGEPRLHAVENFMRTLAPLAIREPIDHIELPVRREAAASIEQFLVRHGISQAQPIIALNCSVGAARPSRNWFPERFSQLADMLIREIGAVVILIGGREDRELVETVQSGMKERAVSAAGALSLAETAALLAQCRCLVSSDTGPLHLATAVQTPVVGLYGSTDPRRTGPVGIKHRVLQKKLPCVPCEKKKCPLSTRDCMTAITTEEVLSTIKDIIKWQ